MKNNVVDLNPEDFFSESEESSGRRNGNRPPRRYYLIVSEGTKTEPNYFEAIKRLLPNEMVKRINIIGGQADTLRLIERADEEIAARMKTTDPMYYHVWIVFDKDSFKDSDFDGAIDSLIKRNKSKKYGAHWHSAWSNQAFELWYLYHFESQSGGALDRVSFKKRLSSLMKTRLHTKHGYKKNSADMFGLLRDLLPDAIKRASSIDRKWNQSGKAFHERNPGTTVYKLVRDLMMYM